MGKKVAKQKSPLMLDAEVMPVAAPQIKRREKWVSLSDEYEGFYFKLWVNAPTNLWNDVAKAGTVIKSDSDDEDDVAEAKAMAAEIETNAMAALKKIVLAHNSWLDFDGNEYPPTSDDAFWEQVPTELLSCIYVESQIAMSELPNSRRRNKRR